MFEKIMLGFLYALVIYAFGYDHGKKQGRRETIEDFQVQVASHKEFYDQFKPKAKKWNVSSALKKHVVVGQ